MQLKYFGLFALAAVGFAGCGAPPPPSAPPAPEPTKATEQPPAIPAASAAEPVAPETPSAAAPSSPPPAAETAAPKSVRSLGDVLIAPSVAYMLNYGESAPKQAAATLCASRAGEDPQKRAECMEKERERVTADVLVFGKSGKVLFLTVYRRAHNTLTELSKSQMEFAKETDSSILVKIKSDKGTRPIFAGKKEILVSAPSESSIAIVCSAVVIVFPAAAFITTIPRLVAAATSMLSTPVPARPTTRSRPARSIRSAVTLVLLRTMSAS